MQSGFFMNCRFTNSNWKCRTPNSQEARDKLETLLETYTDLYDFAPVGYFSIDEEGSSWR